MHSGVLLRDDFDQDALDGDVWRIPTGAGTFLGRTQLRPDGDDLELLDGSLRLRLDTFNPSALVPGDSFFGSEIVTKEVFDRGNGLVFGARVRLVPTGQPGDVPLPGGIVASVFSFALTGFQIRDEIDFEFLTNDVLNQLDRVLTNVFDDAGFSSPGDYLFVSQTGLNLTEPNEFVIAWLADRIVWLVNGIVMREELDAVPDAPMPVRLNFWAPDATFAEAYDPALQPVTGSADNTSFFYEIDYVSVCRCP